MRAWAGLAAASQRAYTGDWAAFTAWLDTHRLAVPIAPQNAAWYARDCIAAQTADGSPRWAMTTVNRRLAVVGFAHEALGYPSPTASPQVRAEIRAGRRARQGAGHASAPRRVDPLTLEDLVTITSSISTTTWPAIIPATRDLALLWTGFIGALRPSELAGITLADLDLRAGRGRLTLPTSKTDRDGHGAVVALPRGSTPARCPLCHLWRWLDLVATVEYSDGISQLKLLEDLAALAYRPTNEHVCDRRHASDSLAPLLRQIRRTGTITGEGLSTQGVRRIIKQRAAVVGHRNVSGQSLRAGFVTTAEQRGISTRHIMRQTRHASPAMIEVYARHHAPEAANAATQLGL